MTPSQRAALAKEIAALAHGKALYALTPVLEALGPDHRERVFKYLAAEYEPFQAAVARLLTTTPRRSA